MGQYDKLLLYKKQRRRAGSADQWQDVVPLETALTGDTGQDEVVVATNSVECGYTGTTEPQYSYFQDGYMCSACSTDDRTYIRYVNSGDTPITIGFCTYPVLRQQVSNDGGNTWQNTSVRIAAEVPLTCEYKYVFRYRNGSSASGACSSLSAITSEITSSVARPLSSMTQATIGDCVTEIANIAFKGAGELTSVSLPDSLLTISSSAFEDCVSLTTFTVPSGVTSIQQKAFAGCSMMTRLEILAATPPSIDNNPTNAYGILYNNNATVYVPAASLATYRTAQYWSSISSRIQAL